MIETPQSNNVIVFPKTRIVADNMKAPSFEEVDRNVKMMKHYHIQETIANIAPMIFNQMDIAGFGIAEDEVEDLKDGAFLVEALRSMLCKYHGIHHPFQQLAENIFIPDEEEEGALRITEELNIKLNKSEDQP